MSGTATINGVTYDLTLTPRAKPVATGVQARKANDFLAIIGVNTHLGWPDGGYADIARTAAAIKYLGVKTVRDSCTDAATIPMWLQVRAATGVLFANFMPEGSPALVQASLDLLPGLAAAGLLSHVEGCNEPDMPYAASQGMTLGWATAFQPRVFAAALPLKLQVLNLSVGAGWTADDNWSGDYDSIGDLSAACHFATAHTYPQHGDPPAADVHRFSGLAKLGAPLRPAVHTEFGYPLADVSGGDAVAPDVQARYLLAAICDAWIEGSRGLWWYGAYDDRSGRWGLFENDGTPRPAAKALHNLTVYLADRGAQAFAPGALDYHLPGCRSFVLQGSAGPQHIVAWAEQKIGAGQDPRANCTLSLGSAAPISFYDPVADSIGTISATPATHAAIAVPVSPIVLAIGA